MQKQCGMAAGLVLGLLGCNSDPPDTESVVQEVATWPATQITYTPSHGLTATHAQGALDQAAARVEALEARVPGPAGPAGPAGPQGPAGAGATYRRQSSWLFDPGENHTVATMCDANDVLIGHSVAALAAEVTTHHMIDNIPEFSEHTSQGWTASGHSTTTSFSDTSFVNVEVFCLDRSAL